MSFERLRDDASTRRKRIFQEMECVIMLCSGPYGTGRGIGGGTGDLDKGNPWPGERGDWWDGLTTGFIQIKEIKPGGSMLPGSLMKGREHISPATEQSFPVMRWPEPSRDGGVCHHHGGLSTSRSRVHRTLQATPLGLLGPLAAPVPPGTQPVGLFPLDFCVS